MSDAAATERTPRLTPQQEDALSVSTANVALGAGAGCGKTSVLTERFLRFLDGPNRRPLRSIVALTFTDKAARELRERVRLACRKKLDAGDDRRYWRLVLRGLEAAPIGTFHAFCGNILRRFPIEAGVEPGFRVLEESIAPSLLDLSLSACFRTWLAEQNEDLKTLAIEHGLTPIRDALLDLVGDRRGHDHAGWASKSEEEILQTWHTIWTTRARPNALARVVEAAEPILRLAEQHRCSHKVMNERLAFLRQVLPELPLADDPDPLLEEVVANARVQGGGNKDHWPSEEVFAEVKDELTRLREKIKRYQKSATFSDEISRLCAEDGLRFARLATTAEERYSAAKREQSYLDFDDLLLMTRDLLARPGSPVLRTLQGEISVLLVDEFQDTDPVQAEILDRLMGSHESTGRLFLVGDTKQSIYRFRGAEPKLFDEFHDRFPAEGRKHLTENFRSAPGVIDFVNALFRESEGFQGERHQLQPRSSGFVPTHEPAVEFLWPFDPELANARNQMSAGEGRRVEGTWIARRIRQLIDQKTLIWDRDTKSARPVHAGDVVLLLRSLNDAAAYEHALVEAGLEYYLVGGSAFFTQQEVQDLVNLLSVIEDPLDEVSLAGALRSPFFGLSDEALYWLCQRGDLASGLAVVDRVHDLTEWDREGAQRAGLLLERWRGQKDRVPIAHLIDQALGESGYEAAILAEYLGARKRANVRKLVRQARKFDDAGLSLADFVTRLRADLRKPPREEQAATTDEEGEAVRIMSIHQAKGLEFPVVVVPDLDRKPPATRQKVAFDRDLGMVVKPAGDHEDDDDPDRSSDSGLSLGWTTYRAIEQAEEEREALRVLYVAATRARERLILSAGVAVDSKPISPSLRLLDSRFDRSTGECLTDLPPDLTPPRARVIVDPPPEPQPRSKVGGRKRPRLLAVAREIERGIERSRPVPVETEPIEDDNSHRVHVRPRGRALTRPGESLEDHSDRLRRPRSLPSGKTGRGAGASLSKAGPPALETDASPRDPGRFESPSRGVRARAQRLGGGETECLLEPSLARLQRRIDRGGRSDRAGVSGSRRCLAAGGHRRCLGPVGPGAASARSLRQGPGRASDRAVVAAPRASRGNDHPA